MFSACTWCKIGVAAALVAAGIALGALVGSGIGSVLVSLGAIKAASIGICVFWGKVATAILGAGLGLGGLGAAICCKLFTYDYCPQGAGLFFKKLGEIFEKTPETDDGSGKKVVLFSKDHCRELRKVIDDLYSAKKIDDSLKTKLEGELREHCPE